MLVRSERPSDAPEISRLLLDAFQGHPHSTQNEHRIVDVLRAEDALSLSLVAETEGGVAGYIAGSPIVVGGVKNRWVGIGPLAVRPDLQRKGIGTALMTSALKAICEQGNLGCVLVGDPGYYARFGFCHPDGLTMAEVPPEVILAIAFNGPLPKGEAVFHPAFSPRT